ncbi:RIO1 family-domain-containing protein [Lasiosphaeris hirsuta]|uniref:Serine/threonine-protein kinase RIO2 n=1 Tax=Lasiosphaeris hirsuta TaxID=260670 RepID=A0AA40AH72_9PEZI|nr:RIO1 family-domain-containing protein [Lasiosphaeris hirsuta]
MLLDTRAMRHLAAEDWKVLAAVEVGTKNHELVPTTLIERLSRLKGGASGVHRSISTLAKANLIGRMKEAKYDGYRLTYGGLDYLALHSHSQRKHVYSVGSRIGVGKESDIMIVADDTGTQLVLKIHRLGRISFRTVKSNRDYLKKNKTGSWMHLSCLAAMKEFAFMQALEAECFPVPHPIANSRHTIVMALVDAPPLRQVSAVPDPAALYAELIGLILRLAQHGLIHGDFNEFNVLIKESRATDPETGEEVVTMTPVLIDFPQMVSMDHLNAEMYFDRDVHCVKHFFERRFHFVPMRPGPFFKDARKTVGRDGARRLDAAVEASGFTKKMAKELDAAIRQQEAAALAKREARGGATSGNDSSGENEDEDDEGDEDEDEDEAEDSPETEGGLEDGKSKGGEVDVHALLASELAMKKLVISGGT